MRTLELGERTRGDEGGKAVERPGEDLIADDAHLPVTQAREQELLLALGLGRPPALLRRRRLALGGAHPVGERR